MYCSRRWVAKSQIASSSSACARCRPSCRGYPMFTFSTTGWLRASSVNSFNLRRPELTQLNASLRSLLWHLRISRTQTSSARWKRNSVFTSAQCCNRSAWQPREDPSIKSSRVSRTPSHKLVLRLSPSSWPSPYLLSSKTTLTLLRTSPTRLRLTTRSRCCGTRRCKVWRTWRRWAASRTKNFSRSASISGTFLQMTSWSSNDNTRKTSRLQTKSQDWTCPYKIRLTKPRPWCTLTSTPRFWPKSSRLCLTSWPSPRKSYLA